MTKITFYKKNNLFWGFKVEGHSGYGQAGTDIVCSAISTATQMTVVGLRNVLKLKLDVKTDNKKAYLHCKLAKTAETNDVLKAQNWFETLKICLEDIESDYKKYLNLEVKDEIN